MSATITAEIGRLRDREQRLKAECEATAKRYGQLCEQLADCRLAINGLVSLPGIRDTTIQAGL